MSIDYKWGANYELHTQASDGSDVQINYPFTLEFDITRASWASCGNCTFKIRNLSLTTNNLVLKDYYAPSPFRYLTLRAGYGPPPWPMIFNGNIFYAYFYKDSGSTDIITEWTGWDFGYVQQVSTINQTIPATTYNDVIKALVNRLVATPVDLNIGTTNTTKLQIGYISSFPTSVPSGSVTLNGKTWDLLCDYTSGKCFIDNGIVNVIKDGDVPAPANNAQIFQINPQTGLLSSPRRTNAFLDIEILFEPNISCGQMVELTSETIPGYNGIFQVLGLEHRGIISATVNGKRTTKLRLLFNADQLNKLTKTGFPNG
jgi:hypothetical protein